MDIQRWLEATTDRAPPDKSEDPDIPEFINPPPAEKNADPRRYHRRKKKGASIDSSVIAPRQDKTSKAAHKRQARSDDSKGELRQSQSIEVISSDMPSRAYERRPRHKTKLDRYEPKTKKPRRQSDARAEKKTSRKRRRSHRNDGERTTGLVQSFQLKNGPKHNRLTLKHDAGAGLFKHGRASAQMTGRGNALPDLVFNEMKFLQRPTEHQDEADQEAPPEKRSKNNKQLPNNDKISEYFNAKDVTYHDQTQAESFQKEPQKTKAHHRDLQQQQQQSTHHTHPSIELPDKPFLGFGSKGAHTQSARDHHDESTEYYSWSESAPRQSKAVEEPIEQPQRQPIDKKKSPRRRSDSNRSSVRKEHHVAREDNDSHVKQDGGKWLPSKRARGPQIVEVYQPPAARKRRKLGDDTSLTRTTRQSLSRFPPTDVREPEGEKHRQKTGNVERLRSDYRTSDILDLPDSQNIRAPKQNPGQTYHLSAKTASSDKENADPQSSIDKLLSQARNATEYVSRPLEDPAETMLKRARKDSIPETYLEFGEDRSRSHRVPFNQLNDRERVVIPNRGSATMMQTPNARHFSAARLDSRLGFADHHHDRFDVAEQMEDDEMLDNEPDVRRPLYPDSHTYDADAYAEDLAMRAASVPRSGFFEAQSERIDSEHYDRSIMRESISRHTMLSHVPSTGAEILNERLDQPQSGIDDVFAGFWKPNKLY